MAATKVWRSWNQSPCDLKHKVYTWELRCLCANLLWNLKSLPITFSFPPPPPNFFYPFPSWSSLSNHISGLSPVYLSCSPSLTYAAKPLRIYFLWNPEIQRQSESFTQQNQLSGSRAFPSVAKPYSIYGLHRNCCKFCFWPKDSWISGKLSWWTWQCLFWLSTFLSGTHHGRTTQEADQGVICCTDPSHHSKTVSFYFFKKKTHALILWLSVLCAKSYSLWDSINMNSEKKRFVNLFPTPPMVVKLLLSISFLLVYFV